MLEHNVTVKGVVGVPVGFVGAAESKEALTIAISRGCRVRRSKAAVTWLLSSMRCSITPGGLMSELSFDAPVWHHGKAALRKAICYHRFCATAAAKVAARWMVLRVNI
ncbi:precorrin-8X methylmutase [Salmonella enterica subsp. enterica]|nr:precorrin-8X methylmutase [Salmonella enterica subsp. enterica]